MNRRVPWKSAWVWVLAGCTSVGTPDPTRAESTGDTGDRGETGDPSHESTGLPVESSDGESSASPVSSGTTTGGDSSPESGSASTTMASSTTWYETSSGTTTTSATDTGESSEESGDPLDPSCLGGTQVDMQVVGWATLEGGTSGGKGGSTITVSTGEALVQALKDKQDSTTPLTIWVDGTITPENAGVEKIDVKDVSDVSILGVGPGAEFNGIGIKITRASNIVLRNLRVHHVDIGDKDGISIEGPADHIWVDHCELYAEVDGVDKDHYDGLLDAKGEAEYITYSWNYLHDSWKTALVGSSDSDDFDRKITMHHNLFRHCNSRIPLFRSGNGHIFNNYYDDVIDTGINSRVNACLKVENNYFSGAKNPYLSAYSDVLGGAELVCNILTDGTTFDLSGDDTHEIQTCVAQVPYDYSATLNATSDVPQIVTMHAGVGRLEDPSDF